MPSGRTEPHASSLAGPLPTLTSAQLRRRSPGRSGPSVLRLPVVHPLFEGEALILWAERPAPAAGWAGPGPARWAGTWPPPHPGALAPDALRALLRTGLSPEGPPSGNQIGRAHV